MNPPGPTYKNRILAALPKAELKRLARHLSPVTLPQEQTLLNGTTPHAYFLEEGMASVVVNLQNGDTVEVGVVGVDGIVGLPILLGADGAPGRTFIQIAGSGYRIKAQDIKNEFERPGSCACACRSTCRDSWCKAPKPRLATGCTTSKNGFPAGC